MAQLAQSTPTSVGLPVVRDVEWQRPLRWLQAGRRDLEQAGRHSVAYGVFVAGAGVLLLVLAWGARYLAPAFIGGFLLVAPFVAIGLYALSRQIEDGAEFDPAGALFAWRANRGSIALFGLVLALSLILWERLAAIVFALFYTGDGIGLTQIVREMLTGEQVPLVIAFVCVGGLLAVAVFALSVVSAPLLLDRQVDVVTALLTSLRCCQRNPGAMLFWAALLAGLTALGFATAMLGMVVLFPWLGHASWHAYRDLVE